MYHLLQVALPEGSPWWAALLAPLVPVLAGILAKFGADGLKQVLPMYDEASTLIKSLVSGGIGLLVGFFNAKFVISTGALGIDPHNWSLAVLGAVFTALFSAGLYRVTKNKNLAIQGAATMEQRVDLTKVAAAPISKSRA